MTTQLETFGKTATSLSRSPLGIIALFIVLVYGIAGLVLAFAGSSLPEGDRWPLVWFLALFPILVLIVFAWLVAQHHTKLYAPRDFPDRDGFFRALSSDEQRQKLDEEVAFIEEELRASLTRPEEATGAPDVERLIRGDIRTRVVVAEELAFRVLEKEYGVSIQRQVAAGKHQRLDGVFFSDGRPHVVEVKLTRGTEWNRLGSYVICTMRRIMEDGDLPEPVLVLTVVSEGLSDVQRSRAKESLNRQLVAAEIPFRLHEYDLEQVEQEYGVKGGA